MIKVPSTYCFYSSALDFSGTPMAQPDKLSPNITHCMVDFFLFILLLVHCKLDFHYKYLFPYYHRHFFSALSSFLVQRHLNIFRANTLSFTLTTYFKLIFNLLYNFIYLKEQYFISYFPPSFPKT